MRNHKTILFALGGMLIGGCSMTSPLLPIARRQSIGQNTTPMIVDNAMELRDWNRSTALYANGGTPAGGTGFLFEESWNEPAFTYALFETPLFIGQTFALPVTLAILPPWKTVIYRGDVIGPTYTAMPPLPTAQNQ